MSTEIQKKDEDVLDLLTKLPKKVSIGQKVSVAPVSQFSLGKGQTGAFSFLDSAGTPFRLHYIKKPNPTDPTKETHLGSVHCYGGECCLREGTPSLYYFIPLIEYTVTGKENGITKYGEPFSFKYLKVKHTVWESKIASLLESVSDPTNADFIVNLTPGKEAYQDYIFTPKPTVCAWRQNAKLNAEYSRLVQFFDNQIEGLAGKHLSDADIVKFYEGDENQQALSKASHNTIIQNNLPSAKPVASLPSPVPSQVLASEDEVDLDDFVNT